MHAAAGVDLRLHRLRSLGLRATGGSLGEHTSIGTARRNVRRGWSTATSLADSRAPSDGDLPELCSTSGGLERASAILLLRWPPERSASRHSICPRCQRANARGSLTTTISSSSPPGCFSQISASPRSISSQPRFPRGGKRRIVETDQHPSARKAFTIKVVVHPRPQHNAGMSVLRLQLGPFRAPPSESPK